MADISDTPLADRANDLGSRLAARQSSHYQVGQSQALALRAQQQLINEHVSQERFQNQTQLLELNRIRQLTEIAKERAVLQNQMTQQVHSANAITALGALDPNDAQYTVKMAQIFHDNPMASKDPIIESLVKSHLESRHVVETTAAHLESARQENTMRLQQEKDLEGLRADTAGKEESARKAADSASGVPEKIISDYSLAKGSLAGETDAQKKAGYGAQISELEKQYPLLKTGGTLPAPAVSATAPASAPVVPKDRPPLDNFFQ